MPVVAIWGMNTHFTYLGLALALSTILILKRVLEQLQIDKEKIPWLICAFVVGSAYWWCIRRSGSPWLTAHIVAVTCVLLAIHEALGKGRGFIVGMFLGMAILSRQLSVYSTIFLCCALWHGGVNGTTASNRKRILNIALFFTGTGICGSPSILLSIGPDSVILLTPDMRIFPSEVFSRNGSINTDYSTSRTYLSTLHICFSRVFMLYLVVRTY
jgi:hypothetical protein